jgi:hypothetical protein
LNVEIVLQPEIARNGRLNVEIVLQPEIVRNGRLNVEIVLQPEIVRNGRLNVEIVLQPEIARNVVSPAMATNLPSTAMNDQNAHSVIVSRHEIPSKDLDPKASVNAKKKRIHHFVNGIFRSLLVKFVSINTFPTVEFAHVERQMTLS